MCLILFAQGVHPDFPLIVAANRDEFHARPTAPAAFREDAPTVLAGRDLEAGGSWMGVDRRGRFAAVTNYTEPPPEPMPPRTRGELVMDFLSGDADAGPYLDAVADRAQSYRGFNLLVGDAAGLWYFSNRHEESEHPLRLEPGIYGLSNHLLDTGWPRVNRGKSALSDFERAEAHPDVEALLALLGDTTEPRDEEILAVPDDARGPGAHMPCFITGADYGTRASTVLLQQREGRIRFVEQRWGPSGARHGRTDETFERSAG
ncbi:MAG: NRDE family protein [Pseudomonadales bacterium]|jgi:uncharacterized protein with NRDE domain|nr:NRDE family protein [Pseudomonadales bacterium]